jgi:hypothetical protein
MCVIALIVIGVCLVVASVAAVFGEPQERAARTNDQRGWWPGAPRRK